MKIRKAYSWEDYKKNYKQLKKLGKIYSEQWEVKYNYLQDNGFWKVKYITYCTEFKDEEEEVAKQWEKDFKTNRTSFIVIKYR